MVWPAVTTGPVPLINTCDTSWVGAVTPGGIVMVGLPSAASATVGSPSTGGTASPLALLNGVRTPLTSMTNSSVSSFLTFDDFRRLASPSFGAIATRTRLPIVCPVRLLTS